MKDMILRSAMVGLCAMLIFLISAASLPAEIWVWQADNHTEEIVTVTKQGEQVGEKGLVSYFTDGKTTFTMSAEGGAEWVWNEPAHGMTSFRSLNAWMGSGWVARGFGKSSDFGDSLDIRKGITVAARVKPIYSHSHGTLMLSVANASSANLPGGSTHVWVGWSMPDEIGFYSRSGTRLKQFVSSVKYDATWCIWTLGARQIGDTVAWDLWINGEHQGADQKAADGSLHTLLYSKDTDRGTSVSIGQRRPMLAPHDAVWDYVAITNEGVIPGWDGGAEAAKEPPEENLSQERQNQLVKEAIFRVEFLLEPGRYADIVETCEDALRRFKGANPLWLDELKTFRVIGLLRQEKLDEAVEAIRKMQAESTSAAERARHTQWIAQIYFTAKRYSDAAEAYRTAIKTDRTEHGQGKARYHLGLCYRELGYNDLARNYMEGVIERYPESEWVKKARGQLYLWGMLE